MIGTVFAIACEALSLLRAFQPIGKGKKIAHFQRFVGIFQISVLIFNSYVVFHGFFPLISSGYPTRVQSSEPILAPVARSKLMT